jgi:HAE1 family hydrophobic/amphiphilic exporter-1
LRAAYDGTAEIGGTVLHYLSNCCRILTDCDEYGISFEYHTQFCVTVIISTLFSLLASFTIIPWLSSRFGKLEHIEGKNAFGRVILVRKILTRFTNWLPIY